MVIQTKDIKFILDCKTIGENPSRFYIVLHKQDLGDDSDFYEKYLNSGAIRKNALLIKKNVKHVLSHIQEMIDKYDKKTEDKKGMFHILRKSFRGGRD